jgi:hypothetical protein
VVLIVFCFRLPDTNAAADGPVGSSRRIFSLGAVDTQLAEL